MPRVKEKKEAKDAEDSAKPAPVASEALGTGPSTGVRSRASSKAASTRTSASVLAAKRAMLLERLEADKAIEAQQQVIEAELRLKLSQLELEKRCNAERYQISSALLEQEARGSRATSTSSGSSRVAAWLNNVAADEKPTRSRAIVGETPGHHEDADSTGVSSEIARMRSALAAGTRSEANQKNATLSRSHLAARSALAKELPIFSGSPEEWPALYASYTHSTEACGYRLLTRQQATTGTVDSL